METLQQMLDNYGASQGCNNWEGFVRECIQHPPMVVDKFNEIVAEFKKKPSAEIDLATIQLKAIVYQKNWPKNETHYMNLLGDNKATNEWIPAAQQEH